MTQLDPPPAPPPTRDLPTFDKRADVLLEGTGAQLTVQEIDLVRQWFHAVEDLNPAYLERADYQLALRIYQSLGMRPSNRLVERSKP